MGRLRLLKYLVAAIFLMVVPAVSFWISFNSLKTAADTITIQKTAGADNFGVVGFISSIRENTAKETAVSKISAAGVGWAREEFIYADEMDFAPYDAAQDKLRSAGIKTLGLLAYPGKDKTHEQWKSFVRQVVGRFSNITAWEIMNEADNYLTPADYVVYLKEAKEIIKGSNPNDTMVLTGITSRLEATQFWEGVSKAGGWNFFDAVGLHIYHDGNPKEDSFNNGNIGQEVEQAVSAINKSGGKKIWVTEIGYDSNVIGTDVQAAWLSESLATVFNFSEVEKVFVYRLYDNGQGYGVLTHNLVEKEAFGALKNTINNIVAHQPVTVVSLNPTPKTVAKTSKKSSPPPPPAQTSPKVDKEKSYVRLEGEKILADGTQKYKIIVGLKNAEQKAIINQKPEIILSGGKTSLTDFVLVGEEWFAYVSSTEAGERSARIEADGQELKTLSLVFYSDVQPAIRKMRDIYSMADTADIENAEIDASSAAGQTYTVRDTKKFVIFMLGYLAGSVIIVYLLIVLYYKRASKLIQQQI